MRGTASQVSAWVQPRTGNRPLRLPQPHVGVARPPPFPPHWACTIRQRENKQGQKDASPNSPTKPRPRGYLAPPPARTAEASAASPPSRRNATRTCVRTHTAHANASAISEASHAVHASVCPRAERGTANGGAWTKCVGGCNGERVQRREEIAKTSRRKGAERRGPPSEAPAHQPMSAGSSPGDHRGKGSGIWPPQQPPRTPIPRATKVAGALSLPACRGGTSARPHPRPRPPPSHKPDGVIELYPITDAPHRPHLGCCDSVAPSLPPTTPHPTRTKRTVAAARTASRK